MTRYVPGTRMCTFTTVRRIGTQAPRKDTKKRNEVKAQDDVLCKTKSNGDRS